MSNKLFQEAEKALIAGDYKKGKKLLSRLIREDRTNETYWYYLSAAVETKKEQIRCLRRVLELSPDHEGARRGLVFLGMIPPRDDAEFTSPPASRIWRLTPKIHVKRKDEVQVKEKSIFEGLFTKSFIRNGIYISLLVVFIVVGASAGWFKWGKDYILPSEGGAPLSELFATDTPTPTPTNTPTPTLTPTPTPTLTPTITPIVTYSGPTFTPTPYYVGTPHPDSDAFISGMDSFENNKWRDAIAFFDLHLASNPDDVDVIYYRGLAYLYNGNISQARTEFTELIEFRSDFAPGYYGYALARLAKNPDNNVLAALNDAIFYDENYLEAYLKRAELYIRNDDSDNAAQDASKALELSPDHAIAMSLLAKTFIMKGQYQLAYEVIELSLQIDPTYIPSYEIQGISLVELDRPLHAERPLEIYLSGYPEDANAQMYMGIVSQEKGDHQTAIEKFELAKELDEDLWKTRYYRGVSYLALGAYLNALDDLILANEIYGEWFATYLNLSIGYYKIDDPAKAMEVIRDGKPFAETDPDYAALYYWRAKYSDAVGNTEYAIENMQSLLEILDRFVPEGWKEEAQEYIDSH